MARTAVNVTTITRAGVAPVAGSAADPANKNSVSNDGNMWVELENTDSGPRTVTIAITTKVDGQSPAPKSYVLAAAAKLKVGPFPTSNYSDQLQIDADSALVLIAAYRIN
jgi:hypothetical protein